MSTDCDFELLVGGPLHATHSTRKDVGLSSGVGP